MEKQVIISVGRECGSGGHVIAEQIAKKMELPLYDRNILSKITQETGLDLGPMEKYDELSRNHLLSRTVRGYSNSPSENLARMEFEYLKRKADKGESFVVVGRCAESVLKGNPALISIFVLAEENFRIERLCKVIGISKIEAEALVRRTDRTRRSYHNNYCEYKWGSSRNYDICIDSSKLGLERTEKILEAYIEERMADDGQA